MLSGEGSYSAVDTERLQSSSGSSLLLSIYKEMPCHSENVREPLRVFRGRDLNLCHLQMERTSWLPGLSCFAAFSTAGSVLSANYSGMGTGWDAAYLGCFPGMGKYVWGFIPVI